MPKFFATCPTGLSDALKKELESFDLKLKGFFQKESGLGFDCSWAKAYEINLRSKVASRLFLPVLEYQASSRDNIKHGLKSFDFAKYIPQGGTFSLKVKLNKASKFKDQKYMMNEIRVGLLEKFEKEGREDISVSTEEPDLEIYVGIYKTNFSFSLNLSGDSLSHRGYRDGEHKAPLRENLAAGLLYLAGWDSKEPLVDFMCGCGTFLIEAALLDKPMQPKKTFAFQKWNNFDEKTFAGVLQKLKGLEGKRDLALFGSDRDPRALESARVSLQNLKLDQVISLKQVALKDLVNPCFDKEGLIVLNPPYGERLEDKDRALQTYKEIGEKLKKEFKGWSAFILSPDPELTRALGMKSFFRQEVINGGIVCSFLGYKVL